RLRPLSETDCYTRLYGQRDPTVTIVSRQPRRRERPMPSGEELRQALSERLDRRDPPAPLDAEAA
ncbi:MAG TPA: hypothetical protein VE995_02360, partial [Gaiellaceae bacterium]|nr:hypothetical protein [Gaiellaceae bacterium]